MKILYICTHNRCRSILPEAITNQLAEKKLFAKSAGSHPAGSVHPLSIQYLKGAGISVKGLQSQSWDEFEHFTPDVVITLCDEAAGETCPIWFGQAIKIHWGLIDPSKVDGTQEEVSAAFNNCIKEITERVRKLMLLAEMKLTPEDLKDELTKLLEAPTT